MARAGSNRRRATGRAAGAARVIVALALAASVHAAHHEEDEPARSSADARAESTSTDEIAIASPSYRLPVVGKPRRRVGGGRRGPVRELPDVVALVPAHVGLTVSPGPTLLWYISDEVDGDLRLEVTLIDDVSIDPLVDTAIRAPDGAGIQRIRLSDHGVELEIGREYQWSVGLVPDPDHRSRDVVATGWIERVSEPEGLPAEIAAAGPGGRGAVYAEAGLWYDALAAAAQLAVDHADDPRFLEPMRALLAQADISLPEEALGVR